MKTSQITTFLWLSAIVGSFLVGRELATKSEEDSDSPRQDPLR